MAKVKKKIPELLPGTWLLDIGVHPHSWSFPPQFECTYGQAGRYDRGTLAIGDVLDGFRIDIFKIYIM